MFSIQSEQHLSSSTSEQHLLLGAEEGIYTMTLNSSEATMELVGPLFPTNDSNLEVI